MRSRSSRTPRWRRCRDAVRERAAEAKLPAEYRALDRRRRSRGDLAALIGIKLAPLLTSARRDGVLITDTRNHYARDPRGRTRRRDGAYANHVPAADGRAASTSRRSWRGS
jgi:hypothetical protein